MRFDSLLDSIGHTPVVRLRSSTNGRLWAKMELMNHFGMKDRFAYYGIKAAKADGRLKDGDVIIESSSGTLAMGLAMVGRALGHEVHIVTDPRIDKLTLTRKKDGRAHALNDCIN
jgi:cysteine synthase